MVDGICCARKLAKFAFALLSSRKFWLSLPLDPSAFFLVGRAHRHQHAWLVDHAKERCVTLGTMPSMLHDHGTLLQDLVCGAIHSVSAYGYPHACRSLGWRIAPLYACTLESFDGSTLLGEYLRQKTLIRYPNSLGFPRSSSSMSIGEMLLSVHVTMLPLILPINVSSYMREISITITKKNPVDVQVQSRGMDWGQRCKHVNEGP